MKKFTAIILCAVLLLTSAGCAPVESEGDIIEIDSIYAPVYEESSSSSEPSQESLAVSSSSEPSSQKQSVINSSSKGDKTVISPTYIKGVLIVNKTYALPSSYAPGVDATAKAWLNKMFAAAKEDGLDLYIASGYRSYERQTQLYNYYVSQDGKAAADRYSARPGHSEHQTGLAFDINDPSDSFIGTPESKWLAKHCYEYGFIIRYTQDKESITGFKYEPWHVRYVGTQLAKTLYESGQCLEEYLGVNSKYAD